MDNHTTTTPTLITITTSETTAHRNATLGRAPKPELNGSDADETRYRELRLRADCAIAWHNTMTQRLAAATNAQTHALNPMRAADNAFDELSHTKNEDWAATHHRWLVAVDAAMAALDAAMAARQEVLKVRPLSPKALALYKEQVPVEHQLLDHVSQVITSKPWETAEGFRLAAARKASIAAETLKHLLPASAGAQS